MSNDAEGSAGAGPSHRSVEIGLAIFTAILGLVVIYGSVTIGFGWAFDGPQAGFFPFYVGLFILGASIVNIFQAVTSRGGGVFAGWGQLRQVMSVVIPTAIYVVAVPWTGIYIASMLLIAFFMRWLGRYDWGKVLAIAVSIPVITFIVFERWFLVPLPKGPIESLFGF